MEKPLPSGLKIAFLIHFFAALIFSLIFLLMPQIWTNLAGVQLLSHELYRLLGAAMLAFGLSSWLAYRAKNWGNVRIVVLTEILWTVLAAAVILYYLVRYSFPPLFWLPAVLMAVFAVVFAYFYYTIEK